MHRGLVALGDSITNGEPPPVLGVHGRSWAQWLAMALELPYTSFARDGALTAEVLREQVPRLRGPYDVATVYAGVNDARGLRFDAQAYGRDLAAIVAAAGAAAERVLVATIPLDLGRPRAGADVVAANDAVDAVASAAGTTVLDLRGFGGRRLVMPDHVHPTALGQLAIADAAARALGAARLPSALAEPLHGRLRADARYAVHYALGVRRQVVRRAREGTLFVR